MRHLPVLPFLCCSLAAQEPSAPAPTPAATTTTAPTSSILSLQTVRDFAWRNIGPCNPVGRVTDIAIAGSRQDTWYVGTGGGGVWRTRNAGTTWEPIFDLQSSVSIGDVAVSDSHPDIVWVGTGEENARNSVQWGDGVYKSTDGGNTFVHVGLRETFQIGHIEIHPTDPDIVFVGALGRLWGENEDRGVYRTKDGGRSWDKVFYLDDKTGCMDVRIDPHRPATVYALMYERKRNQFDDNDPMTRFGEKSGFYRSDDGGNTWQRVGQGLPTCKWGRSGLALSSTKDKLFLIAESERSGWATGSSQNATARPRGEGATEASASASETQEEQPQQGEGNEERRGGGRGGQGRGAGEGRMPRGTAILGIGSEGSDGGTATPGAVLTQVTEGGPAMTAGIRAGDRITKINDEDVKTYADLIAIVQDSRGGEQVRVTYARDGKDATVAVTFGTREGQGGLPNATMPNGGRLGGQVQNRQDRQGQDGWQTGGVYVSNDRGDTWTRLNSLTERPFYYSVLTVDPRNDQHLYSCGTTLWASFDGGAKFEGINRGIHVDFHAFWCDPDDSDHLIAGCDGGVNETFDRGKTWQVHNGLCVAQYYDVCADNSIPYRVMGGLQDNGTWVGPSRTRNREGITHDDWVTVYGGDGFGAVTDPVEPWILFATSQNGAAGMVDLRSGGQARLNRERADGAAFNWDSPFFLSPHNRLVFYHAGNYAYRGDRYAHLDNRRTRSDRAPIRNQDTLQMAVISPRLGLSERGTAVSFAESPRVRDLLYLGTDDGALWRRSPDGQWQQLQQNLPGVRAPRYVSDLVPSHHTDNRVYATLDGHRFDDMRTLVFVSEDRGETWKSLADDLPLLEPCFAIAEDPRNADLLFLGTEYGCYVSLDRGQHWQPLGHGLPTVAVRDLFLHDRDSDLIAGTHGRGVQICDIEPLRQWSNTVRDKTAHLFQPEDAILWKMTSRGLQGHRDYRAPNPPYGTTIYCWFRSAPAAAPSLTIHDVTGAQIAELTGRASAGIQAVQWDARAGNRLAAPGTYSARLKVGDEVQIQTFTLHADPITESGSEEK